MSEVIEQESTELVTLPAKETALEVFTDTALLDVLLDQVREKLDGIVYDMSTAKGRDQCRSDAFRVARSKAALEKIGAAVSAEQKEIPRQIDAGRRYAKEALDKIQEQVRQPLTEWEEAEERRAREHTQAIDAINELVTSATPTTTAETLRTLLAAAEEVEIGPHWQEFEAQAARTKDGAVTALRTALAARERHEAEQAELAKLRAEAEARRIRDEKDRIAKEAAEAATKAAEDRAQAERDAANKAAADAKAEADRRELELKLQAETAERERLEAIRKAEQDRADAIARAEREKRDAEERQLQAVVVVK